MKTNHVGMCDHCGGPIPESEWYTRRGPRRYCSIDCKNTANSRAGNPTRVAKLRKAVREGRWVNPRKQMTPEQISQMQSSASRKGRLREVAEGRWRNPALDDAAREKLSRPRVHGDDAVLHRAIEKLGQGMSMADLSLEEAEAYRRHRRALHNRPA